MLQLQAPSGVVLLHYGQLLYSLLNLVKHAKEKCSLAFVSAWIQASHSLISEKIVL